MIENMYTKFTQCIENGIKEGHFTKCIKSDETLEIALVEAIIEGKSCYFIYSFQIHQGFFPVRAFRDFELALTAFEHITAVDKT